MSIVVTPLGAKAFDGAFVGSSPWNAATGLTLAAGDYLVFVGQDATLGETATGVVVGSTGGVGGVAATSIGATTSGLGSAWIAKGVPAGTGDIVVSFSGDYNLVAANWFLISGESASAPVLTFDSHPSFDGTNPEVVSGTVATGGAAVLSIVQNNNGGNTPLPMTWSGCVSATDTTVEDVALTGNGITIGGNYTTTPGAVSPSVVPVSTFNPPNGFAFNNIELMMVAFGPSAGGAPYIPNNFWHQIGPALAQ
jgi:hypothetical protein